MLSDIHVIDGDLTVFAVDDSVFIEEEFIGKLEVLLDGSKLRLIVLNYALCFFRAVFKQCFSYKDLSLCGVHAQLVGVGDEIIDAVTGAGSAGCVELNAGHNAGEIAEIGGAGADALVIEPDLILAHKILTAGFDQLHEIGIVVFGRIAGAVVELNACAHCQGCAGERAVDLHVFALDGVDIVAAHIGFDDHLVGDDVDRAVNALHDGMEADHILIGEGLSKVVAGLKTEHRRVLSVYAAGRSAARVGGFALIANSLCKAAVIAPAAGKSKLAVGAEGCAVHHKGNINIIEIAPVHEFDLAAHIADNAFFAQLFAESELYHFLCRNGH